MARRVRARQTAAMHEWNMTLARAVDDATALDVAERLLLGFDHAALGGRVCWKWQLPDSLTEAVSYHHDPSQSPDNTMGRRVSQPYGPGPVA